MFSLKTLLFFAIFAAVLLVFADSFLKAEMASDFLQKEINAEATAFSCALIIDSFYANGGRSLEALGAVCYLKEKNLVAANIAGAEKTAQILNNSTITSNSKESLKIEVQTRERYG
ncbi:MAG: hypothetical protein HYW50_04615 [Candidatus Diapherotrites archaeon]|nr:hypothetical protein [Candidatus Diapherotrites archaeon]